MDSKTKLKQKTAKRRDETHHALISMVRILARQAAREAVLAAEQDPPIDKITHTDSTDRISKS